MPRPESKLSKETLAEVSVLIDKGEVEKASALLDGVITTSSSDVVAKQLQAKALLLRARILLFEDLSKAQESGTRALALARESMDRVLETEALCVLGNIDWKQSEYPKSLEKLAKALDIAISIKDKRLEGIARLEKGTILTYKGEMGAAEREFREAILALESAGDIPQIARAYNNLACIYSNSKKYEKCLELYLKSKRLAEKIGYRHMIAWGAYNVGDSYFELGKYKEAVAEFDAALPIFKAMKDTRGIIAVNQIYGLVCAKLGQWTKAEEHFEIALRFTQKNKSPIDEAKTFFRMGLMYKWRADKEKAKRHFQKAIDIFSKIGAGPDLESVKMELAELSK